MAENEAKIGNKSIEIKEEQKKQGPLFAIFPDFRLNFPQFKRESKEVVAGETNTVDEEIKIQKPDLVRLPDARKDYPTLKIEVEESEQGISPHNMWQVYALGGFMILRWIWARWKERRIDDSDKPESGDEGPPSTY